VIARLVIAGTASGVGKTTVATGLLAAFGARGLRPAGFKVGPDFIDPSYHALATGRPGRNLDAFLSGPELIARLFAHGARGADVAVVEGVMGMFDGASGAGELASTAQVAKLIGAPVVLVIDARAMARSAAALVHGFATFDPELRLGGVILNRVGSEWHEELLREALAPLGVPVLGALSRRDDIIAPERHLGLVPVVERESRARDAIDRLGAVIEDACDLEGLLGLARSAPALSAAPWESAVDSIPPTPLIRIAVAAGPAFSFRYEENMELLRAAGAELVEVDPLADEALPPGTGGLYLGGGFPEVFGEPLSENCALRAEIAAFARAGRPVLAECGGLLYLCRQLDGRPMCGVIDAEGRLGDRLALGYREATVATDSAAFAAGEVLRGHEFHYSGVTPAAGAPPAWTWHARGSQRTDGFVAGGVHASYLHTHWAATPHVAARFTAAAATVPAGAPA
jgi:cobyrinic acid a,c-diamide synthase